MDKKVLIIFIIVVVIVAGVVYYFSYQKGYQVGFETGKEIAKLAAGVSPEKMVGNPLEKMPSVNPFEKIINPFKELYRNPFK